MLSVGQKVRSEVLHTKLDMINDIQPANIGYAKSTLKKYSLAALKQLGQNFLCDANITANIANAAVPQGGNVLEIGPGMGALTHALLGRAKKVVAIELDEGMTRVLADTFSDSITLIHADALKVDFCEIGREHFGGEEFAVAGNLPYYITAKLLLKILESDADITTLTAMVQREVANRIAANPGDSDYGALSASLQYYGNSEILFGVSKNCFYPVPDVESAVIRFTRQAVFDVEREDYTKVVRGLFGMRRKTVSNNAKSALNIKGERLDMLLEGSGVKPTDRAENISPKQFATLTKNYQNNTC